MRFKVGDKVRLVNDLPFNPKARGKIAEITSTDELYYLLGSIEGFDGGQVCLYDDEHLLELVESAKILPHQMQEGKIYRHGDYIGHFRIRNGVLEVSIHTGWGTSYMDYNGAMKGFELVDEPKKLKVDTLDHELVKELDGSVKVGCQKISKDDVDKIKKFLSE